MSDTIILHEMVPKWNRLYKQKGEFRQIRWCETHNDMASWDWSDKRCWTRTYSEEGDCRIVDKWLEV